MNVNIQKIDDLSKDVIVFQSNQNQDLLQKIADEVSAYIYIYPRLAFKNRDEDTSAGFYLYMQDKFKKIIINYDNIKSKFSSYLSICLQSHFLNYINKKNKEKRKNQNLKLFENYDYTANLSKNTKNQNVLNVEKQLDEGLEENLNIFFKNLSKGDQLKYILFKLFCFDFFDEEDFVLLKKISKKSFGECLKKTQEINDEIHQKKKKKLQYNYKLNEIHYQYLSEIEEKKRKSIRNKKVVILKKYNSIIITPSIKLISETVNIPFNKTNNIITNFKRNLLKKLQQENKLKDKQGK